MSLNRTILVGRLTKDPELRFTPNGIAVATFTLAVGRPFSNQSGEKETDFINCVIWRKQAENVANYLKKGSLAGVDGRLQTRNYEQDGQRRYVTEVLAESVQFLEPRNNGAGEQQQGGSSQGNTNTSQFGNGSNSGQQIGQNAFGNDPHSNQSRYVPNNEPIDINDDDLPF